MARDTLPGSLTFRDFSVVAKAPKTLPSARLTDLTPPHSSDTLLHVDDLHIEPGEWLIISGPSGAGKSLFLNSIINNSAPPGEASSLPVSTSPHRTRTTGLYSTGYCAVTGRLGLCSQNSSTSLDPLTPLGTQISYGVPTTLRHQAMAKAHDMLNSVGVDPQRYPLELSGGQRQRACLVLALIHHPDILIADEATSALDPATSLAIRDIIHDFHSTHHPTIVMATHDVHAFTPLATRHCHINDGILTEYTSDTDAQAQSNSAPPSRKHVSITQNDIHSQQGHKRNTDTVTTKDIGSRAATESAEMATSPLVCLEKATHEGRLNSCSLKVYTGERIGIIGRSGSGKTSLLQAIMGSLPLDSGRRQAPDNHGWCSFVPQQPDATLHPLMTVHSIIREATRIAKTDEPDYEDIVASLGLPKDCLTRRPHQLSGGQRQRVALARAMATRPSVILADEVISALDTQSALTTMSTLASYQQKTSCGIVVTGHNLTFMMSSCDRILVIDGGHIVDDQPASAITRSPVSHTVDLLHADHVYRCASGLDTTPTINPSPVIPLGTTSYRKD